MDIKKFVEYLENSEDIDENCKQFLDNDDLKNEDIIDEDSALRMISNIMEQIDRQNGYDELIELRKNGYYSVEELIKYYINEDKKVEFFFELLDELNIESKMSIAIAFTEDKNKLKALKEIEDDYYKYRIILTLKNEERKLKALKEIDDVYYKFEIISRFEIDKNKLEGLKEIDDEGYKIQIINGMSNEKSKLEGLKEIDDESDKVEIILGFKKDENDENKLEGLSQIEDKRI